MARHRIRRASTAGVIMSNPLGSVRDLWSATDEQFFRSTAALFSPTFLWGAGTLLASYDPDPDRWRSPTQTAVATVADVPAPSPSPVA
jgi:hypothetical protein